MRYFLTTAIALALLTGMAEHAQAQNENVGPPTGSTEILNLATGLGITAGTGGNTTGTDETTPTLDGYWTNLTETFKATAATSTITFAFRNDPGYFGLSNVTVMNTTTGSHANLVTNGDFSQGIGSASGTTQTGFSVPCPVQDNTGCAHNLYSPTGWKFGQDPSVGPGSNGPQNAGSGVYDDTLAANQVIGVTSLNYAIANGLTNSTVPTGFTGSQYFWGDGSFGAYDTLAQTFSTVAGDYYTISFWIAGDPGNFTPNADNPYSPTDTCGTLDSSDKAENGCGINVVLYAPTPLPTVPEPASLGVLGIALAGLGYFRRRRA